MVIVYHHGNILKSNKKLLFLNDCLCYTDSLFHPSIRVKSSTLRHGYGRFDTSLWDKIMDIFLKYQSTSNRDEFCLKSIELYCLQIRVLEDDIKYQSVHENTQNDRWISDSQQTSNSESKTIIDKYRIPRLWSGIDKLIRLFLNIISHLWKKAHYQLT